MRPNARVGRRQQQLSTSKCERRQTASASSSFSPFAASSSSASSFVPNGISPAGSTPDRGRHILLTLLEQIIEFLLQKEQQTQTNVSMSLLEDPQKRSVAAVSVFRTLIQVCEQRMRRLQVSPTRGESLCSEYNGRDAEWATQPAQVMVAEAMVQELLVSLMEIRMKEKETMVLDEVDNVEIMRKLQVQLKKDELTVRRNVSEAIGDEYQLQELQLLLRRDFLQDITRFDTSQQQRLSDVTRDQEASLQFAWETIQEQKKDIVRLRAENEELKRIAASTSNSFMHDFGSSSDLAATLFNAEPTRAIQMLRSQLSSHQEKNLNLLQEHIKRLEKALQLATTTNNSAIGHHNRGHHDGSDITFDSSGMDEKENWPKHLSNSMIGNVLSRTTSSRRYCEFCRRNSASLLTLQSEIKHLREQARLDEESLVRSEKEHVHLKRENAGLTSALLATKQKQEELRQMTLDLTHEKHQLQTLNESQKRTADQSIRILTEQVDELQERNSQQVQTIEKLESHLAHRATLQSELEKKYADAVNEQDALSKKLHSAQDNAAALELEVRVCESRLVEKDIVLKQLQDQMKETESDRAKQTEALSAKIMALSEMEQKISQMNIKFSTMRQQIENYEHKHDTMKKENRSLLEAVAQQDQVIAHHTKSISELQNEKEVLEHMQRVGRDTQILQQRDLKLAQEQSESLKQQLEAANEKSNRLRNLVEESKTCVTSLQESYEKRELSFQQQAIAIDSLQGQLIDAAERQKALEDHIDAQLQLQNNHEAFRLSNEKQSEGLQKLNAQLAQEVADSKTTILMWMSKYNVLAEEKKKLEDDTLYLLEEQHSLRRQIETMNLNRKEDLQRTKSIHEAVSSAEHKPTNCQCTGDQARASRIIDLEAKFIEFKKNEKQMQRELHELQANLAEQKTATTEYSNTFNLTREQSMELNQQVAILKDKNRQLQYDLRGEEQEKKSLALLVQTLRSRAHLQRNAFQKMLLASEQVFECMFNQITESIYRASTKLGSVEQRYHQVEKRYHRNIKARLVVSSQQEDQDKRQLRILKHINTTTAQQKESISASTWNGVDDIAYRYNLLCQMVKRLASNSRSKYLRSLIENDEEEPDPILLVQKVLTELFGFVENQQRTKLPVSSSTSDQEDIPTAVHSTSLTSPVSLKQDFVRSGTHPFETSRWVGTFDFSSSSHETIDTFISYKWRCMLRGVVMKERLNRQLALYKSLAWKWVRQPRAIVSMQQRTVYWKWQYFVFSLRMLKKNRERRRMFQHMLASIKHKAEVNTCYSKWQLMISKLGQRQTGKASFMMLVRALQLQKRYQCLNETHYLERWRYHIRIQRLEDKFVSAKNQTIDARLSPETTMALGNCVRLLQQFCEDSGNADSSIEAQMERQHSQANPYALAKYLIESSKKVTAWKRTIDQKMAEFHDRKEQLMRLQARCTEMKELVALNKRLIGEMEIHAANRQRIVDAAWNFARAYKTLESPVLVQLLRTREFFTACRRILEVLQTSRLPVKNQIQTMKSKVPLASAAARTLTNPGANSVKLPLRPSMIVPASESGYSLPTHNKEAFVDYKRKDLNDSTIALLENVVGSLRDVAKNHVYFERTLIEKNHALTETEAKLENRNLQLLVCKAFSHWKCCTIALRS